MACSIGSTYVGLTDDPSRRKKEHGNPADWQIVRWFSHEAEARDWERIEVRRPGHCGDTGGAGWRAGYKYTVTSSTRE